MIYQEPPFTIRHNQMPMPSNTFNRGMGVPDGYRTNIRPSAKIPGSTARGNRLQNMLRGLFSGGSTRQTAAALPAQTASRAGATGEGITNTLNNVQQVLKIVQQTAPIVKEYGPMVKNIPAMLRMVKAFNAMDNDESQPNAEEENAEQMKEIPAKKSQSGNKEITESEMIQKTNDKDQKYSATQNGESKPMLFI